MRKAFRLHNMIFLCFSNIIVYKSNGLLWVPNSHRPCIWYQNKNHILAILVNSPGQQLFVNEFEMDFNFFLYNISQSGRNS